MEHGTRPSKGFRLFKWGVFCFLSLLLLIALFYAEENWRGRRAWEKFKHEWEAKGEHFDFASFVPPPVPDDQNFALSPIVTTCYSHILDRNGHRIDPPNTNVVNRLEMSLYREPWELLRDDRKNYPTNFGSWQRAELSDLNGWQHYYRSSLETNSEFAGTSEFPTAPQPQSPAADVLVALSKYDSVIEEMRQASQLQHCRFPLNYDAQTPHEILAPHLQTIMSCAPVLRLRAIAELENGQSERALDDVKLILYLANADRESPFLFLHTERIKILGSAVQAIWEGLAEHKWSDAQLTALGVELAKFDFPSDYQFIVRAELVEAIETINYLERRRRFHQFRQAFFIGEDEVGTPTWNRITDATKLFAMPKGWFYQNDLTLARLFEQSLRTDAEVGERTVSRAIAQRVEVARAIEFKRLSPGNIFAGMVFPDFGRTAQKIALAQASVDMAAVACALERYRLEQGEYPEMLDSLMPRFMRSTPHDIINGQPLKYHRPDQRQFTLYSVGWNETDDGGVVARKEFSRIAIDFEQGDWVWQYPQK